MDVMRKKYNEKEVIIMTDFREAFGISMEQLSRITEIPYDRISEIMTGQADIETLSGNEIKDIKKTLEATDEEICSYILENSGLKRNVTFSGEESSETCNGRVYIEDDCFYLGLNVSDDEYDFCLCKASGENAVSVCSSIDEIFEYYVERISGIYS